MRKTSASEDAPKAASYVDFAIDVIEQAGRIALQYFRTDLEVINKAKKRKYDPVTRADREIETYIRNRIRESYPDHALIGEEYGSEQGRGSMAWLIDPIDGTKGFLSGSPMWGILLGLVDGDDCILGLARQPFLGETYVGSLEGASVLSGAGRTALATRDTERIADAVLCCTHPNMFLTEQSRQAFDRVAQACRFSRFGTDCYGYCLLARGFVDLVVEGDLEPYDIIPLIPIIEAAGGVVSDWKGGAALKGGTIVAAANRALHEQAIRLLSSGS